jgi:hypothetical protein
MAEAETPGPRRELTVRRFDSHEEAAAADLDYWLSLTPEQRLDAVGECVSAYLELRHEPEQRLRRVHRVLEPQPR